MPRQSRLVLPGIALHIVQRGNNRVACFVTERDYLCYLTYLRQLSSSHGCIVHAYCLMTNHVHLLLTPRTTDSCQKLMRDLGQSYVRYFNKQHHRTGTLWEGRYRSCIVDTCRYVLACYRYIELNPVRAGMVGHPSSYPWSSFRTNAGLAADPLATPHEEYLALAAEKAARQAAYLQLFETELDSETLNSIRDATLGSLPLAGESLKAELRSQGRRLQRSKPGPQPAHDDADDDHQSEFVL